MTRRSPVAHCALTALLCLIVGCAGRESAPAPAPTSSQPTTRAASAADAPAATATVELPDSVAVLPVVPKGDAAPETAEALEELLVAALQEAVGSRSRIVGRSDISALLTIEQAKVAFGCDETSCASDVASALGVETVISSSLSKLGSRFILTLAWIDQQKAEVWRRSKRDLGTQAEAFDSGVRGAVAGLLRETAPEAHLEKPKPLAGAGRLTAAEILDTLDGGRGAMDGCYSTWVGKEGPSGKIALQFFIESDGGVGRVSLRSTSFNNPSFEGCVAKVVQQLRFPTPRGEGMVEVNFPFEF